MAEYIDRLAIGKAYMDLCLAMGKQAKSRKGATFFPSDLLPETEPTTKELFGLVMAMPAADVVPVQREKWEWREEWHSHPEKHSYDLLSCGWYCTGCGIELGEYLSKKTNHYICLDDDYCKPKLTFCPNCGARMDEEDGDRNG